MSMNNLTLPYLYGHRDRKATWPGDPILTKLMIVDIQDSYGFGVSNVMFVQCLSSRFLKLLSVSADTTDEGSEFQSLMILVLNAILRVSVLPEVCTVSIRGPVSTLTLFS